MQITPDEIENIEDAGMLDKSPVKILRTRGGFHIAVGKPRGKYKDEVLAAGSHPAIVKFNLEKQFADYQPALMKSEDAGLTPIVVKHTHFLSADLVKSGHDIYSVQNGSHIEFQVTKQNVKVASVNGYLENDGITLKDLKLSKEFSGALAGATAEKALALGTSTVRVQGK